MRCLGFILLCSCSLHAQVLQVISSTRNFLISEKELYLENTLKFYGQSIQPIDSNANIAQVDVTYTLQDASTLATLWADKLTLNSPNKTQNGFPDFQTIEKIKVEQGHYLLKIQIIEQSHPNDTVLLIDDITTTNSALSDIQFSVNRTQSEDKEHPFYKQGFIIEPFPDAFYPEMLNEIQFYLEAYHFKHPDSSLKSKLVYGIKPKGQNNFLPQTATGKRLSINRVNSIFASINIAFIPSGNYEVCAELYDEGGQLIAEKRIEFQRINNNTSFNPELYKHVDVMSTFVSYYPDSVLNEYISWLRPISSQQDVFVQSNLLKSDNMQEKKQYFYYYWEQKNYSNPKEEWEKYAREVEKVNAMYGSKFIKGFDTDRGRVYLQYGPPNQVNKNDFDRNLYPYEIWHYFNIQNQRNRRFVFSILNRSLADEDYQLIHSDMRGEVYNPQWKNLLYRKKLSQYQLNQNNNNVPSNIYYGDDVLDRDFD
jgi:GWxTD domain-containing protein